MDSEVLVNWAAVGTMGGVLVAVMALWWTMTWQLLGRFEKRFTAKVDGLANDLGTLREEVGTLREEVGTLRESVAYIRGRFDAGEAAQTL